MDHDPHLISYLTLRKILGMLGMALPIVLPIGVLFTCGPFQPSISHYYYTIMRDVFVGILWAFGLFLFTYQGYAKEPGERISDNLITNIAGILAIGVALFPTHPESPSSQPDWVGNVHFGCAALFFLILGGISLLIFTKSTDPARNKQNLIYRICGITIWASLLFLLIYFLFFNHWPGIIVYLMEFVMLWAFGLSWIVKGKALNFMGL